METSGFPVTHHDVNRLRSLSLALQGILAVGERFELSKGVNPCWFSRPVHSTALPPHQVVGITMVFMYLGCIGFVVFTTLFTNTVSVSH